MRLRAFLPQKPSCFGFQCIEPSDRIAKQKRMLLAQRNSENGRPHRSVRLEHPFDAPGFGLERLYESAGASYKQMTADDCWLRESGDVAVESVRPLQLKP